MKKILYSILSLLAILICLGSCNDEWKDEQYKHYVSFKAPIGDGGVSHIYIRYKGDANTVFQLPVDISGSTTNDQNKTVHVAIDADTLRDLNIARFQNRTDYYYKLLDPKFYTMPETVEVKAGQNASLMPISFSLKNIDLVDKWVLPITIVDNPAYNYEVNPRKFYKKALLQVHPFNDYSGTYSCTALVIHRGDNQALNMQVVKTYVVDENTIFFYGGVINDDRKDRALYKIKAHFENGFVTFSSDNPKMEFETTPGATYSIDEVKDQVRPYLLHRYISIRGIDYKFTDYTVNPDAKIKFYVRGTMILERKLNTQIPDEDQSIEW